MFTDFQQLQVLTRPRKSVKYGVLLNINTATYVHYARRSWEGHGALRGVFFCLLL